MEESSVLRRITPRMIVGLLILGFGVIWTLNNLGVANAEDYLAWWPVALIALGLNHIARRRWFGAFLWIVIGTAILLYNLGYVDIEIWRFWPVILVLIGLKMIAESLLHRQVGGAAATSDTSARINTFAMMSGVLRKNMSKEFAGGEASAILGGCEIDLRGAEIKADSAVIDVFAMWGGIDIIVPEEWSVLGEVTPILGGFVDKSRSPKASPQKLIVRGTVIMGGVEVKNHPTSARS